MKKISIVAMIACFILMLTLPATAGGKKIGWKKFISYRHLANVVGSVQCESGEPVSRALVYLVGESYMAMTDDEGGFRLHAVQQGTYDLEIETEDSIYGPVSIDVYMKGKVDLEPIKIVCSEPGPQTEPQPEPQPEPIVECNQNNECAANEYCARDDSMCGTTGLCTPVPDVCVEGYIPVCGCDWQTYENKCVAQRAGVSVMYYGECVLY